MHDKTQENSLSYNRGAAAKKAPVKAASTGMEAGEERVASRNPRKTTAERTTEKQPYAAGLGGTSDALVAGPTYSRTPKVTKTANKGTYRTTKKA